MTRSGAPTSKWRTVPPHLEGTPFDLSTAEARLFVERPNAPVVELPIDQSEIVIGRQANEVDLVLDDELVSKRHAKLTVDPRGYFTLEDLGSKNGIHFEGRVVRKLNLVDGDHFAIGRTQFRFQAKIPRLEHTEPVNDAPASIMADVEVPPAAGDLGREESDADGDS